jgi:hypothetical protein
LTHDSSIWSKPIRGYAGAILAQNPIGFDPKVKNSYNVYGFSADKRATDQRSRNNLSKYRLKNEKLNFLISER